MFQGTSLLSLDAKGRMTMPSRHREALALSCSLEVTVTRHPDGCLLIYPRNRWEKKREAIDAKNLLENTIYQAEKLPEDHKDKISDDDAKAIKEAVETAKKTLSDTSADKDQYESAKKALDQVLMPIGAKLYQSGSSADAKADAQSNDAKPGDDADAVEGEVVDK